MTQTSKQPQTLTPKELEQILVVKRSYLLPEGGWHGVKNVDFDEYLTIIHNHKEFQPRGLMEQDPTYKQIIPYLIFKHAQRYFLMQRDKKASEKRLQSKMSLGIGGHIRKEDIQGNDIFAWAKREFHEEVHYDGTLNVKPLGILNDDTNDVGKVHIGFVLLLEGNSPNISIKSELQSGRLATVEECKQMREHMETWSSIALDALI